MKLLLAIAILSLFGGIARAQTDTLDVEQAMSFKSVYAKNNPALKYSFNRYSLIHDYSGNWDLDGDGVPDKVLFVGNNGVHVYYHLVIILSADNKLRDFSWINIDMPMLGDTSEFNKPGDEAACLEQFAVGDLGGMGKPQIYISMDHSGHNIPDKWKKRGVNSLRLLLFYEHSEIAVKNYKPRKLPEPK